MINTVFDIFAQGVAGWAKAAGAAGIGRVAGILGETGIFGGAGASGIAGMAGRTWSAGIAAADEAQRLIVPDSVQKARWAEAVGQLSRFDLEQTLRSLVSDLIWIGLKLVVALLIYLLGRWLIRRIVRVMERAFDRRNVDTSLRSFLLALVRVIFYILLILTVIQLVGINTTSIVALLASAGLAIGMALSGTLQNFAGGVMILLLRPYRVGDFISAQGQSGTVEEIMLFTTRIITGDRQTIFIPNSSISSAIIDNYSRAEQRRVDIAVGISYGDDVEVARETLLGLCAADGRVLKDPEPQVVVAELGESSVNLSLRLWVQNADYWAVRFAMNERIYKALPQRGISFPFPQLDLHIRNNQ